MHTTMPVPYLVCFDNTGKLLQPETIPHSTSLFKVVTWGGAGAGGDSSAVRDQLKNVRQSLGQILRRFRCWSFMVFGF